MDVPTIDGFQCPTWRQDPEQNSMLKAILFTPWSCDVALTCGQVLMLAPLLSNGCCGSEAHGATQPAVDCPRKFTFERAWRTRCSEIHVKAQRAEAKSDAANKFLVLAGTTSFSTIKDPKEELERGIQLIRDLRACSSTWRRIPLHALQQLIAFSGLACLHHAEQQASV